MPMYAEQDFLLPETEPSLQMKASPRQPAIPPLPPLQGVLAALAAKPKHKIVAKISNPWRIQKGRLKAARSSLPRLTRNIPSGRRYSRG